MFKLVIERLMTALFIKYNTMSILIYEIKDSDLFYAN